MHWAQPPDWHRAGTDLPAGVDGCVVHVDPHLLVLNKPSGLLSVPGRGPENADCLSARAQAMWPDALVVHRLDMGTSGLMCMARGAQAQRSLSDAFAQRLTHKRYEAIVAADVDESSHPSDTQGWHTIDLPLVVDWPNRPRSIVSHALGKPSVSRWQVLERGVMGQHTRLALEPVTGRSHQLRVHLQALGHPILGDALYASGPAQTATSRLMLHATHLSLPHPITGHTCHWHCAAPF